MIILGGIAVRIDRRIRKALAQYRRTVKLAAYEHKLRFRKVGVADFVYGRKVSRGYIVPVSARMGTEIAECLSVFFGEEAEGVYILSIGKLLCAALRTNVLRLSACPKAACGHGVVAFLIARRYQHPVVAYA